MSTAAVIITTFIRLMEVTIVIDDVFGVTIVVTDIHLSFHKISHDCLICIFLQQYMFDDLNIFN